MSFLKWTVFIPIGLILYSCGIWQTNCDIPSEEEILLAINSSRVANALQRENYFIDIADDDPLVCPMARYHTQRDPLGGAEFDIITNDLIDAFSILLSQSYTFEDLAHPNVTSVFLNNSGIACRTRPYVCDSEERYRRTPGTCNNLGHPVWGSLGTTQRRLLPPEYEDGFSSPRISSHVYGNLLPNPRRISNAVHVADRRPQYSSRITLHVLQMGQFIVGDILETPIQTLIADCCKRPMRNSFCLPIRVLWSRDPNPFFRQGHCINFQRSKGRFCQISVNGGPLRREQMNTLTSFLDGSIIYGMASESRELAKAPGGLLKDEAYGQPQNNSECTKDVNNSTFCTVEGESTLQVVPSLTAYETLFIREHNRIAEELRASFSTDDDMLFEEAKRIVVAILQKIVYDEFLPAILPNRTIVKYNLTSDYNYTYDSLIHPGVSNEFGIAFRFGHTWIPDHMYFLDSDLYNGLENETATYLAEADERLSLFMTQILNGTAPQTDRQMEKSIRNFLFLNRDGISYDLAAINIQRGRDHGVPSYYKYRLHCGLSGLNRFDQLIHHDNATRKRLSSVYVHVKDIDLYTGLQSEMAIYGGEVGPTLACILGQQFKRIKFGDRYWYQGEQAAFNSTQIAAIQSYTLAKLLCNHLNYTEVNYPNAFLSTDPLTSCDSIPDLDLSSLKTAD